MSRRAFVRVLKLLPKLTEREKLAVLFELEVEGYDANRCGEIMEMEYNKCRGNPEDKETFKEGTD